MGSDDGLRRAPPSAYGRMPLILGVMVICVVLLNFRVGEMVAPQPPPEEELKELLPPAFLEGDAAFRQGL